MIDAIPVGARGAGFKFAVAGVALCALAACGGGGGGDVAAVPAPVVQAPTRFKIDSTNYVQAAREVQNANQQLLEGSDLTDIALAAQVTGTPGAGRIALQQLSRLSGLLASVQDSAVGLTRTESLPCEAGGTTVATVMDNNNNRLLDGGDGATLVFNGCKNNAGLLLNGTLGLTVNSLTGALNTDNYSADITAVFSKLSIVSQTSSWGLDGAGRVVSESSKAGVKMSIATDVLTLSSSTVNSRVFTKYDASTTLDAEHHIILVSNGSLVSTLLGNQEVLVTTVKPVVFGNLIFQSGELSVSGANGSKLRVTPAVFASQASYELDADGDGIYETTLYQPW